VNHLQALVVPSACLALRVYGAQMPVRITKTMEVDEIAEATHDF